MWAAWLLPHARRRARPPLHIVADIKRALVSLVDDRGIVPIDGRDYLTLWLVGHPLLGYAALDGSCAPCCRPPSLLRRAP